MYKPVLFIKNDIIRNLFAAIWKFNAINSFSSALLIWKTVTVKIVFE